jgi:hypothetical protein
VRLECKAGELITASQHHSRACSLLHSSSGGSVKDLLLVHSKDSCQFNRT